MSNWRNSFVVTSVEEVELLVELLLDVVAAALSAYNELTPLIMLICSSLPLSGFLN